MKSLFFKEILDAANVGNTHPGSPLQVDWPGTGRQRGKSHDSASWQRLFLLRICYLSHFAPPVQFWCRIIMIHLFADEKTSSENSTGQRSHSWAECKLHDCRPLCPPFCFLNSAQCLAHWRRLTPNPPFPAPAIPCTPMSIVEMKTQGCVGGTQSRSGCLPRLGLVGRPGIAPCMQYTWGDPGSWMAWEVLCPWTCNHMSYHCDLYKRWLSYGTVGAMGMLPTCKGRDVSHTCPVCGAGGCSLPFP